MRRYLLLAGLLLAAAAIAAVVGYLRLPPDARAAVRITAGRPVRHQAADSGRRRARQPSCGPAVCDVDDDPTVSARDGEDAER